MYIHKTYVLYASKIAVQSDHAGCLTYLNTNYRKVIILTATKISYINNNILVLVVVCNAHVNHIKYIYKNPIYCVCGTTDHI